MDSRDGEYRVTVPAHAVIFQLILLPENRRRPKLFLIFAGTMAELELVSND